MTILSMREKRVPLSEETELLVWETEGSGYVGAIVQFVPDKVVYGRDKPKQYRLCAAVITDIDEKGQVSLEILGHHTWDKIHSHDEGSYAGMSLEGANDARFFSRVSFSEQYQHGCWSWPQRLGDPK